MKRRRVAVVTGTRADYGLLRSTMRAIQQQRRLELQVVVAGMHLLRKFGRTVRDVEVDGFPIIGRVPMQRGDDSPTDQAEGLSLGVRGMARVFEKARSDIVLVLGDRIEALAGAMAGVTTGRMVAHVHGGDVAPGDFDDTLRDTITRLARLHFPATQRSMRRLRFLGVPRDAIHLVGAPGLDDVFELIRRARRRKPVGNNSAVREAIVLFHAHGRPARVERRAMMNVLEAVRSCGLRRRIILPNSDRGHEGIYAAIAAHAGRYGDEEVHVIASLPREQFIESLMTADVLVGNSSCGIIEAPCTGTPSVDVGGRQAGREDAGPTVVHVDEKPAAIRHGIRRALTLPRRVPRRTPYGDGRAGQRIARILADAPPFNP